VKLVIHVYVSACVPGSRQAELEAEEGICGSIHTEALQGQCCISVIIIHYKTAQLWPHIVNCHHEVFLEYFCERK
jgi:hypothetical protein